MSYSINKADLKKNRKDILKIWEKNYPGILEKKFKWMYENNPAGPAQVWVVKHDESGEYIGVTALFPRRFVINGKSFVGGIAGDLLVNKEHRNARPALKLQRSTLSATQDGTVDFIYGFPNKASEPIQKRVGYKVMGEKIRLVKVLKTAPQLSKLPLGKYWGFLLSPIFDLILRLLSVETWYFHRRNFVCEEIEDFDEGFDLLWEKTNSQFIVTGERRAEYLRWKFLNAPHSTNRIFAMFDADRKYVKGYIVYRYPEKSIEIRDFLFTQDKKAIFILMAGFLRYARSLGAQSISIALLKNKKIANHMKHFGFVERKDEHNILIFFSTKFLSKYPFLQDTNNWLLLQSDDDM